MKQYMLTRGKRKRGKGGGGAGEAWRLGLRLVLAEAWSNGSASACLSHVTGDWGQMIGEGLEVEHRRGQRMAQGATDIRGLQWLTGGERNSWQLRIEAIGSWGVE